MVGVTLQERMQLNFMLRVKPDRELSAWSHRQAIYMFFINARLYYTFLYPIR